MPKRKKTHKLKKNSLLIINTALTICLVIALAFLTNLFLENKELENQQQIKEDILKKQLLAKVEEEYYQEQQAKHFEEKTKAMEIEYVATQKLKDTNLQEEKQDIQKESQIFHYTEDDTEPIKTKPIETKVSTNIIQPVKEIPKKISKAKIIKELPKQQVKRIKRLPKLAIIIDDVTTSYQVKKIKNIPYPVTMAFLPPIKRHKNSAKIAQNLSNYMIHLPLEARSRKYEEDNTLHIEDSIVKIEKRIKTLKKLYPKTRYLNNHTGSKFTSNKEAMDKLLRVLKKYDFIFIDSRTTSKTVAQEYAKKHGVKYLSRNIFLDNKQDKKYIQKQLQKAVRIAKRNGSAIAICHPHNITLKILAQSKYLLKGIDLVQINNL